MQPLVRRKLWQNWWSGAKNFRFFDAGVWSPLVNAFMSRNIFSARPVTIAVLCSSIPMAAYVALETGFKRINQQ